jgi:hypothetical protein
MKRAAIVALVVVSVQGTARASDGIANEPWSSSSARTVPRGRWELGVLQNAHYGVTRNVELALHPLWLFALPHLEVKATAFRCGRLALGVRSRFSYPTSFLALVSREGSGGLLPKTSRAPFAVQIEGDVIGSVEVAAWHELAARAGLAVAPHANFTPEQLPLLDFPFLYPRFAAMYSPLVPRAAVDAEGRVLPRLFYHAGLTGYLMPELPDVGTAHALELLLSLEYRSSNHFAVSLGARESHAKYAIGTRSHTLPFVDARVSF